MFTAIDWKKDIKDIKNFDELSTKEQNLIKSADKMESRGFQYLLGFKDGNLIFDAGGYWSNEKFTIQSI